MIDVYYYPPTKFELTKIVKDINQLFTSYFKLDYINNLIVKNIIKDIDEIDIDISNINEISNLSKLLIILNVYPQQSNYFLQKDLNPKSYKYLNTIPYYKTIKLLVSEYYPEEIEFYNIFRLPYSNAFFKRKEDFNNQVNKAKNNLYTEYNNKYFYNEYGYRLDTIKFKQIYKERNL